MFCIRHCIKKRPPLKKEESEFYESLTHIINHMLPDHYVTTSISICRQIATSLNDMHCHETAYRGS